MNININFEKQSININGTNLDIKFLQNQQNLSTKNKQLDNMVSIECDFRDLPEQLKTYQLCLEMYLENSYNLAYTTKEFRNVVNLIKKAGLFVGLENLTLNDYLYGNLKNKNEIDSYITQLVTGKLLSKWTNIFSHGQYLKFVRHMIHSQSVISGSCLLQAFYGKNYDSDYDIFVNKSKCTDLLNFIEANGKVVKNTNNNYCKMDNNDYQNMNNNYKNIYNGLKKNIIDDVCTFNVNSYKIQIIIIVDDISVQTFIENNFDINICKNMCWYDSIIPTVKLYDIDKLILKQARFDKIKDSSRNHRSEKYIDRGFIFENADLEIIQDIDVSVPVTITIAPVPEIVQKNDVRDNNWFKNLVSQHILKKPDDIKCVTRPWLITAIEPDTNLQSTI